VSGEHEAFKADELAGDAGQLIRDEPHRIRIGSSFSRH
jgi:hypothetical protein